MRKINLIIGVLLLCLTAGYGQKATRSFDLHDFDRLEMGSAFKVLVTQGPAYSIVAKGDRDDLDDLDLKVSGKTLRAGYKSKPSNRKGVTFEIQMPELRGLELSGAVLFEGKGFKRVSSFDLDVSGASKVKLEVEADELELDASAASNIVLVGSANRLSGELSGASYLDASRFPVRKVEIEASGASSATVTASEAVHADASGASSIRYSGMATSIVTKSSGASSIKKGS